MGMMDPYFRAKYSSNKTKSSYLEDINRTYYKTSVPPRKSESYDRAVAYRKREKDQIAAVLQENGELWDKVNNYESVAQRVRDYINGQTELISELNSKLEAYNVGSNSGSGSSGNDSKRTLQPSEERGEGSTADVPGEVLPTDVPDTRGQTTEHPDEGRQGGGEDSNRDVPTGFVSGSSVPTE